MVLPCIVSNTLYAVATVWYAYITHLGYRGKGIYPFYSVLFLSLSFVFVSVIYFSFPFSSSSLSLLLIYILVISSHFFAFLHLISRFLPAQYIFNFSFSPYIFSPLFLSSPFILHFFSSSAVSNQHSSFSLVSNNCCHFTVDRIDDPPYFWNSF